MPARLKSLLKLEVPVVVQIGRRTMRLAEVMNLVPGAIIELPKASDEDLEILINNKEVGTGRAVKIGENFGVQVSYVGDLAQRVKAMAKATRPAPADAEARGDETDPASEEALAGQQG